MSTATGAGALPNLIVIGAQKAGTTGLHNLLAAQAGVSMSTPKELDFFSSEQGSWRRGLGWYRAHFDPGAAVRGESSPSYAAYPFAVGVPERIASVIPDVRLVYLVRDPVRRLLSQLAFSIGAGFERRRPAAVLADPSLEGSGYVALSRYATQLERFLARFAEEQILVLQFEEFTSAPEEAVRAVMAHCGHELIDVVGTSGETNPARSYPLRRALRRVMPERAARRALTSPLGARLDRVLDRPPIKIELADPEFEHLRELLGPDADRLRELTGLSLPDWSV